MATTARASARGPAKDLWPNPGGQAEFCSAADPEVAMVSPWGDGKSWGGCFKGHVLAIEYPGSTIVLARKDRIDAVNNLLPVFREDIIGMRNFDKRWRGSPHFVYQYDNGSRAIFGGLRQHDAFSGSRLTYLFVDEGIAPLGSGPSASIKENEWLTFVGRMREQGSGIQQMAMATNPGQPGHWLLRRASEGKTRIIEVEPGSNDFRHPPGYIERKKNLTGVHYQRYVLGLWAGADGLVYSPPWEHSTHAVIIPRPQKGTPIVCAIDWGFSHAFSMGFYYVNADRQRCRFDELYGTGRTVEEWAALAGAKYPHNPVQRVWTDHDPGLQETFYRHFKTPGSDKPRCERTNIMDANKEVLFGVNALTSAMKIRPNGLPGFIVDAIHCPVGVQQIEALAWDEHRDRPRKEDDHAPDEMRYYVLSEETAGHYVDREPTRVNQIGRVVESGRLKSPGYLRETVRDSSGFMPLGSRRPRRG